MSQPIRLLELRTVSGTGGGPEKTILLGARHADPRRFAVTVCYLRRRDDAEFQVDRRADALGLDYVEIRESHPFAPGIWKELRRIVRDRRIEIVHAHEYKSDILAWLLGLVEPIVPLATVHGWFGQDTWRERVYYGADKRVLARFPRLIAVSGALKGELVRTGCRPDAIEVVPNGIDHRMFARRPGLREEVRREIGARDGDIVIGAVGRLERQKRFDLLLEALAALRARHPCLRVFIAGEGGLRAELQAIHQRLGLGDACVLLGHQPDVVRLHHAFDAFVQSSDDEGSPNVVLEAMALETPIVATDVGGARDLVTDGVHGLLVPPGTSTALSEAIERLLTDRPAATARALAARRRVEADLSFDVRMTRVEAIYEELVTGRGRRAT
jgi:glycosyltransferase involved in cell wall biosynthesis